MPKNVSLNVRNKKTLYGEVDISPDTELSMLGIVDRLMRFNQVSVTNLPRSFLFLNFLSVLENLGFTLTWENYNYLKISSNTPSKIRDYVSAELLGSAPPYLLTYLLPLILKLKGEMEVDVIYKEYIDAPFLANLDIDILLQKNRIYLSVPLESSDITLKYDMESLDTMFLFNKILMKNIFHNLRIVMPEYHVLKTANIVLEEDPEEEAFICPPSIYEFKFFCSLLMLLDGEIEFKGYNLKYFLSHLLGMVELGLFYEVIDNKLRTWFEPKDLNLEYFYKEISTQDLAALIMLQTLKSKHNVRNVVPYKKHFEILIKELNISGCRIDYKTYAKNDVTYFDLLVKPSNITGVKIHMYDNRLAMNLSILLPVFCTDAKSRADSINFVEYTLANFRDNINSINLDVSFA